MFLLRSSALALVLATDLSMLRAKTSPHSILVKSPRSLHSPTSRAPHTVIPPRHCTGPVVVVVKQTLTSSQWRPGGMVAIYSFGMSGSRRRKIRPLSPIRAPTPTKCKFTLFYGTVAYYRISQADLIDLDFIREPLDRSLFPDIPSSVEVHTGFAKEQAITATTILFYVEETITKHGATSVTAVGHSLGAALSLLDAAFLRLNLDASVEVRMYGYGMPRVGNRAFANWVDSHLSGQVTHVNNQQDFIPIIPGELLFHHPVGEVHITNDGKWLSCPGQDNPSTKCTVGAVPEIIPWGNLTNHHGPYDGIMMGTGCSQERIAEPVDHKKQTGFINQVLSHFRNIVF
ncbi:Alpha/Beta hydrolase protein [Lactarius quietus]|nr:Alpha/Beta hydrolase protein [Lactarius quietus]